MEQIGGQMKAMSKWESLSVAALIAVLGTVAALRTGNAYIYAIEGVLAVIALGPLWWPRPRYLLIGLILYLPFEDGILRNMSQGTTFAYALPDFVVWAAFGWRAARALQRREPILRTPLDLPVALLTLVAFASALVNHVDPSTAAQGIYTLLHFAPLFYLTATSRFEPQDARFFVRGLVAVAAIECLVVVAQFVLAMAFGIFIWGTNIPEGTMYGSNTTAVYLALAAILWLACSAPEAGHGARLRSGVVILLVALVIVIPLISRQGLLALFIGGTVLILGRHRVQAAAQPRRGAATGVPAVARTSGVSGAIPVLAGYRETAATPSPPATPTPTPTPYQTSIVAKIQQVTSHLLDPSYWYNSRLYEIVNAGPAILRLSPLFGLGPGTFGSQHSRGDLALYTETDVPLLLWDPRYSFVGDVGWMTLFGQFGLLGVVGYLWFIGAVVRICWRAWRYAGDSLIRSLGIACIAFVPALATVEWVGDTMIGVRQVAVLLWFVPGLILSLLRRERSEEQPAPVSPLSPSAPWDMDRETQRLPAPRPTDLAHPSPARREGPGPEEDTVRLRSARPSDSTLDTPRRPDIVAGARSMRDIDQDETQPLHAQRDIFGHGGRQPNDAEHDD